MADPSQDSTEPERSEHSEANAAIDAGQSQTPATDPGAPPVPGHDTLLFSPILDVDSPAAPRVSYDGWPVDHAGARRFYVVGLRWIETTTREYQATHYYEHVGRARTFITEQTNWTEIGGRWDDVPAYNQFRRASHGDALTFDRAAYVVAAYSVAWGDWAVANGRDPMECFQHLALLPACFNLDDFSEAVLAKLRTDHPNFDATVTATSGQRRVELLDDLAKGHCVTLRTARGIRDAINGLAGREVVGPVCGRPGRHIRGRGPASSNEIVETHRPEREA